MQPESSAGIPSEQRSGADTPPSSAQVRTVAVGGCEMVIETRDDGTVLVNGDLVEPVTTTRQRFLDST